MTLIAPNNFPDSDPPLWVYSASATLETAGPNPDPKELDMVKVVNVRGSAAKQRAV